MAPPRILAPAAPHEELDVIEMVNEGKPTPMLLQDEHVDGFAVAVTTSSDGVEIASDDVVPFVREDAPPRESPPLPPPVATALQRHGGVKRLNREVAILTLPAKVSLPGLAPTTIHVALDISGQHTLTWDSALHDTASGAEVLPAGRANLYLYPLVSTFERDEGGERAGQPSGSSSRRNLSSSSRSNSLLPAGAALDALDALVIGLATGDSGLDEATDEVGAHLQHALAVANSDEALDLLERLLRIKPALLRQCHTRHRSGLALFTGESTLHILAANCREPLLCALIELATRALPVEHARSLFTSQATGVFFHQPPMCWYGGTPLSYACAFELREAITAYLASGLVGLNDRQHACKLTGFLPIHTTVAHGHMELHDHLIGGLAEVEWRADPAAESRVGKLLALNVHGLSPLALATQLGDHDSVKHLLRKQCEVLWVWGPVTQHSISLSGIDSTFEGGCDMMELVARVGASRGTQELLLDSFMHGFLYKLFVAKWDRYRRLYVLRFGLDVVVIGCLVFCALTLKANPTARSSLAPPLYTLLLVMAFLVCEEVRIAVLWWRNTYPEVASTGDRLHVPVSQRLHDLAAFLRVHYVFGLFASYGCAAIAAILLLSYELDVHAMGDPEGPMGSTEEEGARRVLKAGGTGGTGGTGGLSGGAASASVVASSSVASGDAILAVPYLPSDRMIAGDSLEVTGMVWLTLGLSMFLMLPYLASVVFTPFETPNVFLLSMVRMLKTDLLVFILIFLMFTAAFYVALYTIYPRAGNVWLPHVRKFNDWHTSLETLLELALTGSPALIDLSADYSYLSYSQLVDLAVFLLIYTFYAVFSVILLLNLLIAMFTHTFDGVRNESTLNSRVAFAQSMLRLELIAASLGMKTAVGEPKPNGDFTYDFRSVVVDGGGVGSRNRKASHLGKSSSVRTPNGNGDPFARTVDGPFEKLEVRLEELRRDVAEDVRSQLRAMLPVAAEGVRSTNKATQGPAVQMGATSGARKPPSSRTTMQGSNAFGGLAGVARLGTAKRRLAPSVVGTARAAAALGTAATSTAGAAINAAPRILERQLTRASVRVRRRSGEDF